jgi:hypothetical protein
MAGLYPGNKGRATGKTVADLVRFEVRFAGRFEAF